MQITPQTADYIAAKSGGTAFEQGDLASPQINIAYGAWYLDYLQREVRGQAISPPSPPTTRARAPSTSGSRRPAACELFDEGDIQFPETREYVDGVLDHRARVPQALRRRTRLLI